jgi:threonine/homoserine/homoserine lactone efflux protein
VGELLINIAPLALGAAVNPGMTGAVLTLLLSGARPLARAVAFVLGAVATSVAVGVLGLMGVSNLGPVRHTPGPSRAESLFFLGAGLLLLILVGWHAWRTPSPKSESGATAPRWRHGAWATSPKIAFLIGAGFMLTNLGSLVLFVVALRHIVDAQLGWIVSAMVVLGFMLIMLCGMVLAIIIYAAEPQRAAHVLARARQWIAGHARLLMIIVGLVLGAYLTLRGIVGLAA